jgi:hypothetical protein
VSGDGRERLTDASVEPASSLSRTTHDDVSISYRSVRWQVWLGKGILGRE